MEQAMRFSILDEPLLSVIGASRARSMRTLPEVLACLSWGEAVEFAALQPHQFHAWHAFLVQLGALALQRDGLLSLPTDAAQWRDRLLSLTGNRQEPWCLFVADLREPAFLQPPIPEGSIDILKKFASRPDEIDVLLTTKNHDIKASRFTLAEPQHWLYYYNRSYQEVSRSRLRSRPPCRRR